MAQMSERAIIDDFLAQKRIAIVGVSRKSTEFANGLFRFMRDQGYDVVPVNPNAAELEGATAYPSVKAIPGSVDAALIMTPPRVTEAVVRDCAEAGIPRVWLHRAIGDGATSEAAIAFCRENGIDVVPGRCPYMFLGGFPHNLHGWILKITGNFPT